MRILIVEDDRNIADVVRRGLIAQHYSVDVAGDGDEGLDLALSNDYDAIVLDIMLPKRDGTSVSRALREEGITTPILMLTALAGPDDIIHGLDQGGDDYLTKPFDFGVLLARLRSLTRRSSDHRLAEIRIADLTLDVARRRVERSGRTIPLTAKEFALLEYFAMNKGKVLSREAIGEHVWDINFDPRSNVIESLMHCLRHKIDKGHEPVLIHTVRGMGYRLDDEPIVES